MDKSDVKMLSIAHNIYMHQVALSVPHKYNQVDIPVELASFAGKAWLQATVK